MGNHRRLRGDPDWGIDSASQCLPGALALACSAGLAGQRLAGRAEPPGPGETGFGAAGLVDLAQGVASATERSPFQWCGHVFREDGFPGH